MEGYKVGLCNMQGHFVFGETQGIYISNVISNFFIKKVPESSLFKIRVQIL
jgi:hypothetical protein